MLDWKGLALAAGAAIASGALARAADLPPAPTLPASAPVEDFSGWYLRGDVGVGIDEAPELQNRPDRIATGVSSGLLSPYSSQGFNNTTLSPSSMVDFGAGYRFNDWFRMDTTLEYRWGAKPQSRYTLNDAANPAHGGGPLQYADFYRANLASVVGLVNGYVDLPGLWGVTPFIGAGIGFADNTLSGFTDQGFGDASYRSLGPVSGYFSNGSKTSLAWALMAGLNFAISPNLKLELGYRYLNYGSISTGGSHCLAGAALSARSCNGGVMNTISSRNELASNDIRLGLIWTLGEPAIAPAAIVTRY